ncbi:hypothetical protein PoB_005418200 [Plakobranchus ocellatus]|uniref:Uncharacterized protein n=1 Tax=Plakobranchus ocellatus TaxID=259542 RepID=A0AAV4C8R8_9GAST|nr:hypothetical protein PoB_005418200 [Plakobranchus ocellatus]
MSISEPPDHCTEQLQYLKRYEHYQHHYRLSRHRYYDHHYHHQNYIAPTMVTINTTITTTPKVDHRYHFQDRHDMIPTTIVTIIITITITTFTIPITIIISISDADTTKRNKIKG